MREWDPARDAIIAILAYWIASCVAVLAILMFAVPSIGERVAAQSKKGLTKQLRELGWKE